LVASRKGADVDISLERRRELDGVDRGERRPFLGVKCFIERCLEAIKGRRSWEGTVSSRLMIDVISNPNRHCSRASPRVQCYSSHRARKLSTHMDRR